MKADRLHCSLDLFLKYLRDNNVGQENILLVPIYT